MSKQDPMQFFPPLAPASARQDSARHDVVVVGASAGGVEALAELAAGLPAGLPAAILIVLHMPAYGHSVLPHILGRRGPLLAAQPEDGEIIRMGRIYVARPDHHLLVRDGRILLTRGPAENNSRPAIDALFRSAARAYGSRVIGVVLSGTLDDGTAGLQAIHMRGGKTLVQDPAEAMFAGMPRSAVENVAVDAVQPLAALTETLVHLVGQPAVQKGTLVTPEQNTGAAAQNGSSGPSTEAAAALETDILEEDVAVSEMDLDKLNGRTEGRPSGFSCPDCHGVLWEISEGDLIRYRCRVGHAFSPESLFASQSEGLEEALWAALRALEESAALADRLQSRSADRGHVLSAQRFAEQALDARTRAAVIHNVLVSGQIIAAPSSSVPLGQAEEAEAAL